MTVAPGLTIIEAEPRQSKPPFNDVKVRYALNQAIDKDAIIANVLRGAALPLRTPSIPGLFGTFDFDPLPFDPAKAKQLLAEAGYPNGFEATIRYVSGRWSGDDQVAEAMQGFWNNVGIKTTDHQDPERRAGAAALGRSRHDGRHRLPAAEDQRVRRLPPVPDVPLGRDHQDGHGAAVRLRQPGGGQAARASSSATFEPDKRLPILKQAQELIWKDQPLVFLAHQSNVWGNRKNVSGFRYVPSGSVWPGTARRLTAPPDRRVRGSG